MRSRQWCRSRGRGDLIHERSSRLAMCDRVRCLLVHNLLVKHTEHKERIHGHPQVRIHDHVSSPAGIRQQTIKQITLPECSRDRLPPSLCSEERRKKEDVKKQKNQEAQAGHLKARSLVSSSLNIRQLPAVHLCGACIYFLLRYRVYCGAFVCTPPATSGSSSLTQSSPLEEDPPDRPRPAPIKGGVLR